MNEKAKTLTFLAVAAAVVAVAVLAKPSLPVVNVKDVANLPLYPEFKDPLAVASLEIVEYDPDRGELHPFHVAQVDVKGKKRWSIPSHDDYPADAKDQVATAASGLMGLKAIGTASQNQGDQREYGVIDPDPKSLKVGDTGVGTRVVMKDKDGKELLALIIGKPVKDRPNLRYVRKVGESPIYIVETRTDKLSTKFENWIERNLLGINSFDIHQLKIHDYSVDEFNGTINQRGDMEIAYSDTTDPKWKLISDRKYVMDAHEKKGRWESVTVPANDELNIERLDSLKSALDDLKIIDVSRKPAGLSADLKAVSDFTSNVEAVHSLRQMGFYVAKLDDDVELFSNEGEIRVIMNDGVQYVLRFGAIAGGGDSHKEKKADAENEKDTGGLDRYLFVSVEFTPDVITKPKPETPPSIPKDAKPEEKKAAEAKLAEIEKENKRKQDEYDQRVADGKKRVAELNARFADWYYVISDNVYRKIHLSQDDLFKKKEAAPKPQEPESPKTPAAKLKELQQQGPGGKK